MVAINLFKKQVNICKNRYAASPALPLQVLAFSAPGIKVCTFSSMPMRAAALPPLRCPPVGQAASIASAENAVSASVFGSPKLFAAASSTTIRVD
jgi:hypothetical protein